MSNTKIKAVEDFRNLSRGFKAVIALADELEAVGNLQQASDELTASIGKLRKERDALLDSNAASVAAAEAKAASAVAEAKQTADALLADAKVKAESVVAQAQAKADTIADEAGRELKATLLARDNADLAWTQISERHAALQQDVTALEAKLEKLQGQARKMLEG